MTDFVGAFLSVELKSLSNRCFRVGTDPLLCKHAFTLTAITVERYNQPQNRLKHKSIVKLLEIIGNDYEIYRLIVNEIYKKYAVNGCNNPLYCTLRSDLLMAMHDMEIMCCRDDPVHSFVWCLYSGKRSVVMDDQKLGELFRFINEECGSQLTFDMCMILKGIYIYVCICVYVY